MVNVEMDGVIKIYLKEIGKTPLLTREEEIELAQIIQQGKNMAVTKIILDILSGDRTTLTSIDIIELKSFLGPIVKKSTHRLPDIVRELKELQYVDFIDTEESQNEDSDNKKHKEDTEYLEAEGDTNSYELNSELRDSFLKIARSLKWIKNGVVIKKYDEKIAKQYEQARSHMIKANLRLVVKIAQDYANYGLPLLDLISEGNIGLMKAVERFDPDFGAKLSTYAAWWIKQAIKRGLANQSKTIRLPVHMIDKITQMHRMANNLSAERGGEATDEELAEAMGTSTLKIGEMKRYALRPASLDAPISDEDTTTFGEIVADEKNEHPLEALELKEGLQISEDLLDVLDERERTIIEKRFGLGGEKPKTLDEVGQEFGVTRERIRQLQNIALKKLRRALEKKENPIPGSRRWMGRPEENLLPNDGEDIELEEGDEDTKTERSPTLTPAFLQAARTQLASMQPKKSRQPRQKKPKNGVPKEDRIPKKQTINSRLNNTQKQKLRSLILGTSSVRKSGTPIKEQGCRIIIISYYLGLGASIEKDIPEIAEELREKEEDVLATLVSMARIYLTD